jgi:hypothetical protein
MAAPDFGDGTNSRERTRENRRRAGPQPVDSLLLSRLKLHDGKRASVGALRFPGAKRESAKWAAVSANTNMDDVFKLLTEVWHLEPPPVIISVTGAALGTIDELKSLPKLIFRRGLAEAARRTNAWIITGGTCAGIMQLVGQTVRESEDPIVCLGISTMGVVHNHEQLLMNASGIGEWT